MRNEIDLRGEGISKGSTCRASLNLRGVPWICMFRDGFPTHFGVVLVTETASGKMGPLGMFVVNVFSGKPARNNGAKRKTKYENAIDLRGEGVSIIILVEQS